MPGTWFMAVGIARTKARHVPPDREKQRRILEKVYEWIEGGREVQQQWMKNTDVRNEIQAGISARNSFSCPIFSAPKSGRHPHRIF